MASYYGRRENPDGSVSQNVAVTDSDGVLPVDLRDHGMNPQNPLITQKRARRIVLNMQGTTIAAGATLNQTIDLSGADKAIWAIATTGAITGSMSIANMIGTLWIGGVTTTLSAVSNASTANTFMPVGDKQICSISNTGGAGVPIIISEVIAQ